MCCSPRHMPRAMARTKGAVPCAVSRAIARYEGNLPAGTCRVRCGDPRCAAVPCRAAVPHTKLHHVSPWDRLRHRRRGPHHRRGCLGSSPLYQYRSHQFDEGTAGITSSSQPRINARPSKFSCDASEHAEASAEGPCRYRSMSTANAEGPRHPTRI